MTFTLKNLIEDKAGPSLYRDRKFEGTDAEYKRLIGETKTVYIGNLSFFTTEEQIHALCSECGPIKKIIMGLDRIKKTPCGFAFVEYFSRESALDAKRFLDGARLDERYIRMDLDPGFKEGRQFGRGRTGGQVRDEFRDDYDEGRGGWGYASTADKKKIKTDN